MTDDWYFVSGIDVLAPAETGGIVALGDSLTDANISTHDAFCRWPDQLARRLVARGGRAMGVMNQGLGGNRILHDIRGDSGLRRFDRDVLAQPGVTHVDRDAGHQRSAQPLGEARGGGHRRADDRRPEADGAAGAGARHQDLRRHADAVRERDLPGGCLDAGARGGAAGGECLDQGRRRVRCGDRLRQGRARSRASRRACCRSTTAAITCTRAMSATTGWATSSTWRCSIEGATLSLRGAQRRSNLGQVARTWTEIAASLRSSQ